MLTLKPQINHLMSLSPLLSKKHHKGPRFLRVFEHMGERVHMTDRYKDFQQWFSNINYLRTYQI